MDAVSKEQVDRLAEDIAFVKKAIEKNSSILQRIDLRFSVRLVTLLSALAIFFFCGVFHILIKHFCGFSGIPLSIKAVAFCAILLVGVGLGLLKNSGILKSVRAVEPGVSWTRLVGEYYSIRVFHHFIPMGVVIFFSCVYAVSTGNPRFLIPILSIGIGLMCNNIDTLLRLDEVSRAGYWFIVSGCVVIVFNAISPLLSLCLTMGCGFLVLSALWYLPRKKQSEA